MEAGMEAGMRAGMEAGLQAALRAGVPGEMHVEFSGNMPDRMPGEMPRSMFAGMPADSGMANATPAAPGNMPPSMPMNGANAMPVNGGVSGNDVMPINGSVAGSSAMPVNSAAGNNQMAGGCIMRPGMERTKAAMMQQINEASFAMDDVLLFLDTHPEDTEALNYYRSVVNMRKNALDAYQRQFGPLLVDDVTSNTWDWVTEKWPWEGGY